MKRHAIYLWTIFLLFSLSPGKTAEESREAEATLPDLPRLRQEIQRLKDAYRTKYLDRDSDDLLVFDRIGEAARSAPEMIDALIDLCEVKSAPSSMIGGFSPGAITPAACELSKLELVARQRVEAALSHGNLTVWQRAVLKEVIDMYAWAATESKGMPPPEKFKYQRLLAADLKNVPSQKAGELLIGTSESGPPAPQTQSLPQPLPHPPVQMPAKSQTAITAEVTWARLGWGLAVGALLLAFVLISIKKWK